MQQLEYLSHVAAHASYASLHRDSETSRTAGTRVSTPDAVFFFSFTYPVEQKKKMSLSLLFWTKSDRGGVTKTNLLEFLNNIFILSIRTENHRAPIFFSCRPL